MSAHAARLEAVLARLYTDARLRARFLRDPAGTLRAARVPRDVAAVVERIDREALVLFAESLDRRQRETARRSARGLRWARRRCRRAAATLRRLAARLSRSGRSSAP